jgi:formate dehydrogenase subunit gamma
MATKVVHSRKVLRYRLGPRIVHALLALSFLILLCTGLTLLWPPLSRLAAGGLLRQLHYIGAVLFMAVPFVYLIVDRPAIKELLWDSCHYDRDDWNWFKRSYYYFVGRCEAMPAQGRLNAGQKLHHAGVVIFSASIVFSGLVMWFGKGMLGSNGMAMAAIIHNLSMLILAGLLVGHLYFTYVYNALAGMVRGYIPEEEARLEHSKWVRSLPEKEPWIVEEPDPVTNNQSSSIQRRLTDPRFDNENENGLGGTTPQPPRSATLFIKENENV